MNRHVTIPLLAAGLLIPGKVPAQGVEGTLVDLARVKEHVRSKRISSYDRSGGNADGPGAIPDGERRALFEVQGAGMITHIWITIGPPPPTLSRNDILLRMYWDGNEAPSVESPIGPFFGQGWDEGYDFASLPLAAGPAEGRALVSYFVMPFSHGARIEIENDTGREIQNLYYYIDYVELDTLSEDMGRFHAWYNHKLAEPPPEDALRKNTTGSDNYLIADIEGKGHFVGVNYYVHSPTPWWYGEGDDMIFIDGEPWPPSLHGTGTEDYFNTAFGPNTLFGHPYFGYARVNNDVGYLGRTHAYRFHISDPIYFDESLKFTIEHGHDNNMMLDLATVAYWYQTGPHKPYPPLPDREARAPKKSISACNIWREIIADGPTFWGRELRPDSRPRECWPTHSR
jgi:hypothetical protein